MSADATADAVILDYLAHGRSDDDRPQYEREPLCYAIGEDDFQLYEMRFSDVPDISIGDTVQIKPRADMAELEVLSRIQYDDLSSGARSELPYVVEELLDREESRFVEFFNNAQPISLRLHQLNLLPGIGDKLRDAILDARKRRPFESFEDIDERIDGLHDSREILIERITEELQEPDLKYYLFVGPNALLARG